MTGNIFIDGVIAVLMGYAIWRVSIAMIRMMSTPRDELDPESVRPVNQDYKCTVCGAEMTMKSRNTQDDAVPRHCREDMIPVWRPA